MARRQFLVRLWHAMLQGTAVGMAIVYAVWQLLWLARGQLPPALFLAATGLPAPTTGGTRSVVCLLRGDWKGSLHHNTMAMPIVVLAVASAAFVLYQLVRRHPLRLPRAIGIAWVVVLALAWSIKLVQEAFVRWA